ncbi:MAG: outer membrane protein assembly factor [Thiofilum sp.]|uniref:autotransporter assembly complex protein TamA n=1 Tax=Thiofilum sp. TaxID=2212733 RepID=UPI0025EB34B5|nr:outer membrane protein assembly factor [Thiofilum sp.]MBK8452077.1 outer membrane protein assembly factor [Thiofilum sp.]
MKHWDVRWLVLTCLVSTSGVTAATLPPLELETSLPAVDTGLSAEEALASLDSGINTLPSLEPRAIDPALTAPTELAEEINSPADPTVGGMDDFRRLPDEAPTLGEDPAGKLYPKTKTTKANAKGKTEESPVKTLVSGADKALSENIIAFLPSKRRLNCATSAERIERFIEAAQPKLQEAAEAMGYFDAQFKMTSARREGCWVLNVAVNPGKPIRVQGMNIKIAGAGANTKDFKEIQRKPPYQVGDVMVHQPYEDYKDTLNQKANQLGYFDAEYKTKELQIDPDKRQGKVVLDYNTGERYRYGQVEVKQDVLNQEVLQRHLKVRPGEYYDSEQLLKQQRLLEASGYYKDVQIVPQHNAAKDKQIPVNIQAERNKRYTYTGKLGYGADTKTRFEVKMDTNWVNDKGHKLTAEAVASQPESSLGFTYKVPLWQPEHEFAALSAGWERSNTNQIKSSALKSEFSYNRRNDSDWQQTAFVSTLYEATQPEGSEKTRSQLTLLGARVKKTEADDLLYATQGWQLAAELQGSKQGLLSDQTLVQGKVAGKYLKTLESKNKVILQGTVGTTYTDDLTTTPKSLRFFAGGQNSVRGYDFQSLGTKDANDVVIGGKHLIVGSAEFEKPIRDKLSLAAFVDAGNAFEDWSSYDMKWGLGAGVRYQSPLGPIRVDLAVPKDDFKDFHFYFSLGPDL